MELLSRDEFREAVFARDNHKCVVCGAPAQDAHHIIERRLFPDGGYYLDNGASVCGDCHLAAEATILGAQELRDLIGVTRVVLPPHLYNDLEYDKWGNVFLSDGMRAPGELFHDESVQKILNHGDLSDFTHYVKHPRTHHLPWSPGLNNDDRVIPSLDMLKYDQEGVVVTVKLDGEQTTMYSDHTHARSIDTSYHASRTRVRNLWGKIAHEIPEGWRVCGENMQAIHSIAYRDLPSPFFIHSIWTSPTHCLSWRDTQFWAELLEMPTAPVLYEGSWEDAPWVEFVGAVSGWCDEDEGYVVRLARELRLNEFPTAVAKYVRENHVQPDQHHWFAKEMVENEFSKDV